MEIFKGDTILARLRYDNIEFKGFFMEPRNRREIGEV
jgi:hypothetical protein